MNIAKIIRTQFAAVLLSSFAVTSLVMFRLLATA